MYGDVPYGSLFSLLQRFGMRLGQATFFSQEELDELDEALLNEQYVNGK